MTSTPTPSAKFKLLYETRLVIPDISKTPFYRIQALCDFADVKAGDLGGYLQKVSSLDESGTCWVYPGVLVMEGTVIQDHAVIWNSLFDAADPQTFKLVCGGTIRDWARITTSHLIHSNLRGTCFVANSTLRSTSVEPSGNIRNCKLNGVPSIYEHLSNVLCDTNMIPQALEEGRLVQGIESLEIRVSAIRRARTAQETSSGSKR